MLPEDLSCFRTVSDPQLHPDGVQVAFVVSRMDLDEDRYERQIWLWDGESARTFTRGPADSRPRWSPGGTRLAFLRATGEKGDPAQVAVMPFGGGEATTLTEFAHGATEAEWSPDGSRLAVIGSEWVDEWADLEDDERGRKPRRIVRAGYQFDNLGWRHDRRSNVYLVDPDGGDPAVLSPGDYHDTGVCWRPDGAAVGFLSARHDTRYADSGVQAWEVPVAGGESEALTGVGVWSLLAYRPDGTPHLVGFPDVWGYPCVAGLWRLEHGTPVAVAEDLDRSFVSPAPPTAPAGPQWFDDGGLLNVLEDRGRLRVIRLSADDEVSDVLGGDRLITGVSTRGDGSAFAFAATSPTDPGNLWWWEDGTERRLTDLNSEFAEKCTLLEPQPFTVENDGVEIDAWAVLPPGDGPVPLLLNIHGGPATQYGFGFFDEFQIYAAAGYGVIACNPRGSSGRGRDYMRVPVECWVEERPPDLEDILAVAEGALERFPRLDRERMGIMGGSYGGLMTGRILPLDHRFRSAVPERGLYSFTSFAGTSDIGLRFPRMYLGTERHFENWEALWQASPLSRAHQITTPCLIIHSEQDHRCPIEQGEQLFAVLLANGVEAEMLRFPGESHELSRSGKPRHRRERFEAILDWHERHLAAGDVET
jgi:dipeptidyl aminopeptidase/acylaminoacyl peptidase